MCLFQGFVWFKFGGEVQRAVVNLNERLMGDKKINSLGLGQWRTVGYMRRKAIGRLMLLCW